MKAWLIVNEFLATTKYTVLNQWLLDSATKHGIEMTIMSNAECLVCLQTNNNQLIGHSELSNRPDFVVFWDKDVRLAKYLEQLLIPVYNSSQSIANCDDKSLTHLILQTNGIQMPKTILAPMTYPNIGYNNYKFLEHVIEELGFPMVVKECFGSFGAQVYLAHDRAELNTIVKQVGAKPMLFQEFIAFSAGRDVRLQVVGDEVVASMYRYSEHGDFRANISNGGSMKPYEPSEEEKELAVRCCKLLDLTFGGVDLLFGESGHPIVCEVNSNAHFKNIFDCTGVDTADKIIEYLMEK